MRQRYIYQSTKDHLKNKSKKLTLVSNFVNKQIFENKYQMPNNHEFVDTVASLRSGKSNGEVWFTNLDFKKA